jgi:hypothetical protein
MRSRLVCGAAAISVLANAPMVGGEVLWERTMSAKHVGDIVGQDHLEIRLRSPPVKLVLP